ncbi:hypothetical protein ABFZ85_13960 [Hyphococcus formosus]|uniref:hypothetical protein n=1 Tax=Hyphococcus formosus TaxID=3143534 RepID=UPI00398AC722
MTSIEEQKRQEAVKALINIAMLEGVVLLAVIGVYFYTNNFVHLIGGIVGSTLIFGPMFVRWFNEHGKALKAKPNSDVKSD